MTSFVQLPSAYAGGHGPGVQYRIEGELLPVLHLQLDGSVPVYFEHHVVLWKQPQVDVALHKMKGAFKRVVAGMPIFMTEARGVGEIAFSRDAAGQVIPLNLPTGSSVLVREHQMLAATGTLDYSFERVNGLASMLAGSQGFFVDRFDAVADAVLWLHAYGNAFEVNLAAGEQIDVEPGSWIYREQSVGYSQQVFGLKTGILGGGGNLVFNRFTGPGRVGLQSGYFSEAPADATPARPGAAGVVGGIVGGLLGN